MLLSRILGFTKEEEHTILEGGKVCEPSAFLAENFLRRGVSSLSFRFGSNWFKKMASSCTKLSRLLPEE
jgi:hypothetical protein